MCRLFNEHIQNKRTLGSATKLSRVKGARPSPVKSGDLNGSMQHLLTVFINAVYEADFVRGRQSKQSKALVRF